MSGRTCGTYGMACHDLSSTCTAEKRALRSQTPCDSRVSAIDNAAFAHDASLDGYVAL